MRSNNNVNFLLRWIKCTVFVVTSVLKQTCNLAFAERVCGDEQPGGSSISVPVHASPGHRVQSGRRYSAAWCECGTGCRGLFWLMQSKPDLSLMALGPLFGGLLTCMLLTVFRKWIFFIRAEIRRLRIKINECLIPYRYSVSTLIKTKFPGGKCFPPQMCETW